MPTNKILVVDNTESTRHFTRFILSSAGFRVSVATTPSEALEYVTDYSFDAIITDVLSPDLEGVELVDKIRSLDEYGSVPILMITLTSDDDSIEKGYAAGVTEWLTKPVSHKVLVDRIKQLCPAKEDDAPLF